jgi:hypothetical protein
MKKYILFLSTIIIGSPVFAYSRAGEYPLTMMQPRYYSGGYHQPKYFEACIKPEDNSTCFFKRSSGVPERQVTRYCHSITGSSGKIIKTECRESMVINPTYLNLNKKPMTKEEIENIENLIKMSEIEHNKMVEKRNNENDFVKQWF